MAGIWPHVSPRELGGMPAPTSSGDFGPEARGHLSLHGLILPFRSGLHCMTQLALSEHQLPFPPLCSLRTHPSEAWVPETCEGDGISPASTCTLRPAPQGAQNQLCIFTERMCDSL